MRWLLLAAGVALSSGCSSLDRGFSSVDEIHRWGHRVESKLDLGGWDLWQVMSSKGETFPSFYRFYAVRGGRFVKISDAGDLIGFVERMDRPEHALEFCELLETGRLLGPLLLDGTPGVSLPDYILENHPALQRAPCVRVEGDDIVVERIVGTYGSPDRAVRIRERLRRHFYRWEVLEVFEDEIFLPRWM